MKPKKLLITICLGLATFGQAQSTVTTSGGTTNVIPMFTGTTSIGNSGVSSDGASGLAVPGSVAAGAGVTGQTLGGIRYASQYGNKTSNGISTAASGATNQMVIADPSYPSGEQPGPFSFSAAPFHYEDLRQSVTTDFYRNPTWTRSFGFNMGIYGSGNTAGHHLYCLYDTPPSTWTGNSLGGCEDYAQIENMPGWSIGNPAGFSGGAANGWSVFGMASLTHYTRTSGITETLSINQQKYSTGDNASFYVYTQGEGGTVSASDEGTEGIASNVTEDNFEFSSTCSTGCTTGSTSIKTPASNSTQGQGRYLYDSSASATLTGHVTAIGSGLGTGTALTVDATVPVSNAWGTLVAAVNTPVLPQPPFSTTETFSVNVVNGTFDTTHLACFAGNYHEQAIPTAVGTPSGGVQSVTFALRRPHASGTYLYQGGACGNGIEFTSLTMGGLQYLYDVVGSTDASTLQTVAFAYGASTSLNTPVLNPMVQTMTFSNSTASSGTTVTFAYTGGTLYHPWNYLGQTITISGSSDSALNTNCTNIQWTSQTTGTCTIAGLSGTHTTTSALSATLALNSFNLWPIAEVLDVQNETLSPPQVDGTLNLEPNVIAFASGNTVNEVHHYSGNYVPGVFRNQVTNPLLTLMKGLSVSVGGNGAQGGGGSATSNAMVSIANNNADSYYQNSNGFLAPPNAFNIQGPYLYGFNFSQGPRSDMPLINVQSDSQQSNPNYNYALASLVAKSGAFSMQYFPNSGNMNIGQSGTSGVLTFYAPNGIAFNNPITTAINAGTNAVTGGQFNLTSGSFQTQVKAPTGTAASYVETLPATGTTGQLVDIANSAATVSGDVATFSNTTGRIQDSGKVLPIVASLTTTAATSNTVTVTGMTSSGHCSLTPTNASAATNISTTYISAKTTNQITVTHTATASMTYDVLCAAY